MPQDHPAPAETARDRPDPSDATQIDSITARLDAVERAVSGGGSDDLTDLATAAEATDRLATAAKRLDDVEDRLADLESATQALRGYVGAIRAVNERVERRADRALAAVERFERESSPAPPVSAEPTAGPNAEPNAEQGDAFGDRARDRDCDEDADEASDVPLADRLRDAL